MLSFQLCSIVFLFVGAVNPEYHQLIYEGEENLSRVLTDQSLQESDSGAGTGAIEYSVSFRLDKSQGHSESSSSTLV